MIFSVYQHLFLKVGHFRLVIRGTNIDTHTHTHTQKPYNGLHGSNNHLYFPPKRLSSTTEDAKKN
jgi:hypothetical protein